MQAAAHEGELAQGQKSADVKHISLEYPFGPYRAIGPEWQNSREKPHVLTFWPTMWPKGSGFRPDVETACDYQELPSLPTSQGGLAGTAAQRKGFGHNGL